MKKLFSLLLAVLMVSTLLATAIISASADDALVDISANHSDYMPDNVNTETDIYEVEEWFDNDGMGFNHRTVSGAEYGLDYDMDYYYMKGDPDESYLCVYFTVPEDGQYEITIGLMALTYDKPRTCEVQVNERGDRYYFSRLYDTVTSNHEEYITGITSDLYEDGNAIIFYLGHDFNDSTVKSVFIDKFICHRVGDLADPTAQHYVDYLEEKESEAEAENPYKDLYAAASEDYFTFTEPYASCITNKLFCTTQYVTDAELNQEVLECTVGNFDDEMNVTLTYETYLKLLDKDITTPTCDNYKFVVFRVKAENTVSDSMFSMYYYTLGNTQANDDDCRSFYYRANGEWQYVILDMTNYGTWQGALYGMRIDFCETAPAGAKVWLADMKLFATKEDAYAYAGKTIETKAPKETKAPDTETEAPATETEAPVTETEVTADAETTLETLAPATKSGCGSVIGTGIMIVTVSTLLGTALCLKGRRQ